MALSNPPAEPGGGVIWVKTAGEMLEKPLHSRAPRISASASRPSPAATKHRAMTMALRVLRTACRRPAPGREDCREAMSARSLLLDAHQQQARNRQHDEGDDEQQQAKRDQRGGVELAVRLGEFIGDGGGNGGAGTEDRRRNL